MLEAHAAAILRRGWPAIGRRRDYAPISDDFVLALRAEADGDDAGGRRRRCRWCTVAANLGELELLYPEPVQPAATAVRTRRRSAAES